jgi:3-dehydroquinate synthase
MVGNVYLVGFMGSGKSTVGAMLAARLNRELTDMDELLEKEFGKSVTQVFEDHGEDAFRERETRLLSLTAQKSGLVVATGGGLPIREENRAILKESGISVYLQANLNTLKKHVGESGKKDRPLWNDDAGVSSLLEERRSIYEQSDIMVRTDKKSPERVTEMVLEALVSDSTFDIVLDGHRCAVTATLNGPNALIGYIAGRRVFLVTDATVERLHGGRYRQVLGDVPAVILKPGEQSKSLTSARKIYEKLLSERFDRDDVLVAIGGGVVTDLGAMVASTFKRGMGLILVSTTLVGCVDAAVGGKAAVNLGQAKNVVGCFSIPDAVVLDLEALGTLYRKQLCEGIVEAYKTGLIADANLAGLIESNVKMLLSGDLLTLSETATRSAAIKAKIVSEDFRESGRRMILNFGHTYGHAVEGYNRFRVSHGTAVALGMRVATEISRSRGLLDSKSAATIDAVLTRVVPKSVPAPPAAEAWDLMLHDKKIRKGNIVFVLPDGVGKAVCVDDVTLAEISRALKKLEETNRG